MNKVPVGLGLALALALGGVGVANLASGADHSDPPRQLSPTRSDHGRPAAPGQSGAGPSSDVRRFAQQHRDGMRAWQQCHQAGRASCVKPAPPGWLKHPDKHPGGWPPEHGKSDESERSDEAEKPERPDKADKPDRPDKGEKSERGEGRSD